MVTPMWICRQETGRGMYTVGVLWGFRTQKELEENRAHHILSAPSQIPELVDMKNNGMPADPKVRLVVSDVGRHSPEEWHAVSGGWFS